MANIDSGSSWLLSIPDALCRTFSLFTLHINAQGHCLERLQWCMHANESIIFSSRAFPECRLSSAKEREHCIPWSAFKNHVLITGALFTCQQWMHTHLEFICKIYIHFTDETVWVCVCAYVALPKYMWDLNHPCIHWMSHENSSVSIWRKTKCTLYSDCMDVCCNLWAGLDWMCIQFNLWI